jgi:hypothetical protein
MITFYGTTTPHTRPFKYPVIQEYATLGLDPTKIEFLSLFDPAGNLYDASGNKRHGTTEFSGFTGGRYGNGGKFDGIDDRSQITNFNPVGNNNTELSVFLWMKSNGSFPNLDSIVSLWDVGTPDDFTFDVTTFTQKLTIQLSGDGTTADKIYTGTANLFDADWHHLGFTYKGTGTGILKLYEEGIEVTPDKLTDNAITTLSINSTDPLFIGCHSSDGTPTAFQKFSTDNILIYSGVLDDSQILNKHNVGL